MTKSTTKNPKSSNSDHKESPPRIVSENRRARFEYEILEEWEAGIALTGTEVKSCRAGKVQLADAYGMTHHGEIFLQHADIAPYTHGNIQNHAAKRLRKLLLHRHEIEKIQGKIQQKGLTLVPLKMYFKGARVKVLLGLGRGKKLHDKRDSLRKKDHDREMDRAWKKNR